MEPDKQKRATIVGGALILALAALAFLFPAPARDAANVSGGARWEERIREVGGAVAYEEFAASIDALGALERHERAHEFGAALYAAEGAEGVGVCDARFSYGCFHEFLGRAIAEKGSGVIRALNERCFEVDVSLPLTCQHGIGHGVLAYVGYSNDSLGEALGECRDLPGADAIGGCYGGVLMEYNLRTMLSEEEGIRVPEGSLLAPCDTLSAPYDRPCAFWQPQWWSAVLATEEKNVREVYRTMGELCRSFTADAVRLCFEGAGVVAPIEAKFEPREIRALCAAAAESAREEAWCVSFAADTLARGGAGERGDGEAVCASLAGVFRDYCLSYARGEASVENPPPVLP